MASTDGSGDSMPIGSPSKLNDGSWGARVQGTVAAGERVEIRTRSGKTWQSTVSDVIWSGEDNRTGNQITLCSLESDRKKQPATPARTGRAPKNPLTDAGQKVAKMADELSGRQTRRNERALLSAITELCAVIHYQVDFRQSGGPADTSPSKDAAEPQYTDSFFDGRHDEAEF